MNVAHGERVGDYALVEHHLHAVAQYAPPVPPPRNIAISNLVIGCLGLVLAAKVVKTKEFQ